MIFIVEGGKPLSMLVYRENPWHFHALGWARWLPMLVYRENSLDFHALGWVRWIAYAGLP